MLRIALVGLGHVARHQIAALELLPNVRLVAGHDPENKQASLLPAGTRFHRHLEEMLKTSSADLFVVATPNSVHYEVGRQILMADRAVLIEKPASTNNVQLDELLSVARTSGQFVCIALHATYARDVEWWVQRAGVGDLDLGPITGFEAGFFDPYVRAGAVDPLAASLGGAWFDSGINALSVIGRFVPPDLLRIEDSRMSVLPQLPCSEVQGLSIFSFATKRRTGRGLIDTNWTLGLNRKVTRLFYDEREAEVLLHHSQERVRVTRAGRTVAEVALMGAHPRLTNHYYGLFADVEKRFHDGRDNLDFAVPLHRLLFAARDGHVARTTG